MMKNIFIPLLYVYVLANIIISKMVGFFDSDFKIKILCYYNAKKTVIGLRSIELFLVLNKLLTFLVIGS